MKCRPPFGPSFSKNKKGLRDFHNPEIKKGCGRRPQPCHDLYRVQTNFAQSRTAGCPAAVAEAAIIAFSLFAILSLFIFTYIPWKYSKLIYWNLR
jgi:hypothetical protein